MSAHPDSAAVHASAPSNRTARAGGRLEAAGAAVMLYGLALIFLWFGGMKFTSYEAQGISPLIMNSPLVS